MATISPTESIRGPRGVAQDGPIYRLSVDQYRRMIEQGILTPEDRVELLEGVLVPKMAINPPHRIATRLVRVALERILPPGWYADQQQPIATAESVPEPDVAVIRGETTDYPDRHPGPDDLALVVEVADSSPARDQAEKKRIYARSGIAVYWLVNLPARRIEVYSDPTGPADAPDYRAWRDYGTEDMVPVVVAGRELARLAVRDLLPRREA